MCLCHLGDEDTTNEALAGYVLNDLHVDCTYQEILSS